MSGTSKARRSGPRTKAKTGADGSVKLGTGRATSKADSRGLVTYRFATRENMPVELHVSPGVLKQCGF